MRFFIPLAAIASLLSSQMAPAQTPVHLSDLRAPLEAAGLPALLPFNETGRLDAGREVPNVERALFLQGTAPGALTSIDIQSAAGTTNCTTYYVAAAGLDTNSGCSTTTPWQTIARVNSATFSPGTSVLFNGGDSFSGCILLSTANIPSGGNKTNPIVFGAYGSGKPTINSNCPGTNRGSNGPKSAVYSIFGVSGLTVQDQNIGAGGTLTQFGFYILNGFGNTSVVQDSILIQRNSVSGFQSNAGADVGFEVFVQGYSSSCGPINNLIFSSNVFGDASNPGAVDQNGIGIIGCGFAGQAVTNTRAHGNIYQNIGGKAGIGGGNAGSGFVPNGIQLVRSQFELFHDIGARENTCGAGVGAFSYLTDQWLIEFSEAYNIRVIPQYPPPSSLCDVSGFGFDRGNTNSTAQYLFAHNNTGSGFYTLPNGSTANVTGNSWGPNTVRYSIFENNVTGGNGFCCGQLALEIESAASPGTLYAYNLTMFTNVSFSANNSASICIQTGAGGNWGAGSVLANNICEVAATNQFGAGFYGDPSGGPSGGPFGCAHGLTIINNGWYNSSGQNPIWSCYNTNFNTLAAWAANSGGLIKITNDLTSNPGLTSVGAGGNCMASTPGSITGPQPCPSAYKLSSTSSPYIGAGLNLTISPYSLSIGTRDYYGNTLPLAGHGTGYAIGADGGVP
jgi:hypothetical protein